MLLRSPPQPLPEILDVRLKKASSVDPGDVETYTRQSSATFDAVQPFYCDGLGWVRLLDGEVSPVSPSSSGNNNDRDTCYELQTTRHTKMWSRPPPELRAYLAKLETSDLETEGQQQTVAGRKRQQTQVPLLFSSSHSSKLNLKRRKSSKTVKPARNGAVGTSELGKGPLLTFPSMRLPTATNDACRGQIVRSKPTKPNAKTPGKAPANKDKPASMTIDIDKAVESNQLHSLTVPQLKAACRQLGLPVGGKKADLEQRIRNFKSEC